MTTYRCRQCGQEFVPKDSHRARSVPKYCSRQCSSLGRRKRVRLVCRQCGQEFERKAYMQDWSQARGPFCGFACYGQWQREHPEAAPLPKSPHGHNPDRRPRGPEWEQIREQVLERDQHRCVTCHSRHSLHVHHIRPYDQCESREDANALDNLLTLCKACHRRLHNRLSYGC